MAWFPTPSVVKSYLYGASTPIPSTCVVNGKRIGLVEALIADINARGSTFWDGATLPQLHWLKSALDMANVLHDHPLYIKLHDVIDKCSKSFPIHFAVPVAQRQDCFAAMELEDHFIRSKVASLPIESSKTFSQRSMSIKDMMKVIDERGDQLEVLELTRVNDALLLCIAAKCSKLKSLSINLREEMEPVSGFTDEGLKIIAKLKFLDSLELNIWNAVHISRDALKDLLGGPELFYRLKSLKLATCLVNDQILILLAGCKCLNELSLISTSMTPVGLETMMLSASLRGTLESLTLRMGKDWGTLVTNSVLNNLRFLFMLRELFLDGKWVSDDGHLQALLVKSKFEKLHLNGVAFSPGALIKCREMPSLRELYVGDWSSIGSEDYMGHYSSKKMETLGIRLGTKFTSRNMYFFNMFSNLSSLALVDCPLLYSGLNFICEKVRKLTSLEVADNALLSGEQFGPIALLTQLACLRIINCPHFNDDSVTALRESPVGELELNRVSLSNAGLSEVAKLKRLDTLMISKCGAITKKGWTDFLQQPQLHARVRKLQLNFVPLTLGMVPLLQAFQKLEVLRIKSPVERKFELFDKWEQAMRNQVEANESARQEYLKALDLEKRSVRVELDFGDEYSEKVYGSWGHLVTD